MAKAPCLDPAMMRSGESADWAILDADLLPEAVSPPGAAWPKVASFALSFDGYAYRGQELGRWANGIVQAFRRKGVLMQALSLTDLRALLLFEQRRLHHFGTTHLAAPADITLIKT